MPHIQSVPSSERESLRSLPALRAEGLEGLLNLPFSKDGMKRTGLQSLPKTEGVYQKQKVMKRIRPKTFKILFSQIKRIFQAYQCMADLFPNHVKEEEYRNSWIIFVNIYLAHP